MVETRGASVLDTGAADTAAEDPRAAEAGRDEAQLPGADAPMILALEGADREAIQGLLAQAARRFAAAGTRVLGVVEHLPPGGDSADVLLLDLVTGATLPLHQNLGSGAGACSLDPSSLTAACAWVESAIAAHLSEEQDAAGTVVILSKFGRQEAEGRGLTDAFHAAVAGELKILTSVSPSVRAEWSAFAGDLARIATPDLDQVDAWWAVHRGGH